MTLRNIRFDATLKDRELIKKITRRAMDMLESMGDKTSAELEQDFRMDLTAVHLNDTPIDLGKLLGADDFNFVHDIMGIRKHLNRTTGKLENCFLPRCAKRG